MPAAIQLVILLSVGSFQGAVPSLSPQPSAVFPDTAQGAKDFVAWLRPTLPPPKFAQPPLQLCVVGAVPFTPEQAPVLPKPVWESKPPWHSLEPYAATFHYVEPPKADTTGKVKAIKPSRPRTLKQALQICAQSAAASAPGR